MNKMLVVVDVQNDFVFGDLGSEPAKSRLAAIKEKIATYLKNGDRVVFTKDTHDENYLNTTEGKNLPVPHCIKGTWGHEIVDGIYIDGCDVFEKDHFGSDELLKDFIKNGHDLTEVEFVGFCTDICVISNALAFGPVAARRGIKLSCDASCCAGVTPSKHAAAIEVMRSCQIEIKGEEE